jgi:hypothetical protein
VRKHRIMFGKAFNGAAPVTFRDAASLEGPADVLRAIVGQMVRHERSQAAAIARSAYLHSLTGLDGDGGKG